MRISDWSSDVCSSDLHQVDREEEVEAPGIGIVSLVHRDGIGRRHQRIGQAIAELDDHQQECQRADGRRFQMMDGKELDQQMTDRDDRRRRSEEHTSELQSLMRISYAVFCLKKKKKRKSNNSTRNSDKTQ